MTPPLTVRAVQLAQDHFADNLLIAFVGGSYARGNQTLVSDIDVFVLLGRSDRATERAFAEELRILHERAGLHFDHCGELFDIVTLGTLLTFTEQTIAAVPGIQHAACYQADCPLSAFRKGDVVFKFLDDPKLHTVDPGHLLAGLEERAAAYFRQWPMPRIQQHKSHLALPPRSRQANLADAWRQHEGSGTWADTPVGVGLERWFGAQLTERLNLLDADQPIRASGISPRVCPMHTTEGIVRRTFAAQCLASSDTSPEAS